MYTQTYSQPVTSAEREQEIERFHFSNRRDWRKYDSKTPEERNELNTRMRNHPAKNHSPVGLNNIA